MKKRFGIMIVMGAALVAGVSFLAWGRQLDAASLRYVKKTVPVIFERWTSDALIGAAGPQLLKAYSADQIERLFISFFHQYGDLKAMNRPEGRARIRLTRDGVSVSAAYLIQTSYEKSDAAIQLLLQYRDWEWQIAGFHIVPVKK